MSGDHGERYEQTVDELRAALARERARLRALQDIGLALGSTLDLDELLDVLLTRTSSIVDCDRATLFVLDEDRGELWSKIDHAGDKHEVRLSVGEGLAGWVAKTGRTLNVKDAYQDVRFNSEWDRRTGYRTRSALCVPVKNHHGRALGVLQALNRRGGYFTRDDEVMLTALASHAAISLENSKLFLSVVGKNMELLETKEQLERKVRELDVLFEIAQVSASAMRLDDLLEGVLARAMHAIDAEAGSILLADKTTGDLRFRCAVGGVPEALKRVKIIANEGICGWVAHQGKPQIVNDVDHDSRHSVRIADQVGYHPRSVLCVPLLLPGRGGAMELLNKGQGAAAFTDDDLKLASVIAGHVSTAIRLAEERERRERQERLSTIGQLLSSVLHDLRGPMTVISGYARFIGDELDDATRKSYGNAILHQVETINAMTREILAFAKGDKTLWVRKVYLRNFFEQILEQLKAELEGRGIELSLHVEDGGVGYFDQSKIQRAVLNLARNAAQAIGSRAGKFSITVSRDADTSELVLTCADDGPGVPDAIREQMFESFTTHGNPEGTGLGLAIVRKIVDDHGGSITMDSRPGDTVFTIRLPQKGLPVSAPPEAEEPQPQVRA